MTASLSVYLNYRWLTIVQSSLNTSWHIKQPLGQVQNSTSTQVKNIILSCGNEFSMFHVKRKWCILLFGCAQRQTWSFKFFLLLVFIPHLRLFFQLHHLSTYLLHPHPMYCVSHYFTTQLKIDVLRSSSMGWNWPQTELITLVLAFKQQIVYLLSSW